MDIGDSGVTFVTENTLCHANTKFDSCMYVNKIMYAQLSFLLRRGGVCLENKPTTSE